MSAPHFPDDENGDVLRRMHEHGDDLSQPRMMDFCFTLLGSHNYDARMLRQIYFGIEWTY